MTLSGAVAVAGVYEHPTRWAPDKTEFQIMAESAKGALDDAGLTIGDVDALFAASMTMSGMGIVDLAEYLDLKPTYLDGTNIGGSSFVAHVAHAAAAIHAGMCEVALVLYGSTAASNAMAIGTGMGGERRDPGGVVHHPVRHDDGGQLRARRPAPPPALRHDGRATRRDRRHDAPPRVVEPGGQDAPADHRRRRARQPHDLRAPPPARLLHHQRRRRRRRRHVHGAGAGPAQGAGAAARLRRGGGPPGDGAAGPASRSPPASRAGGRSRWPASATTTSTSA